MEELYKTSYVVLLRLEFYIILMVIFNVKHYNVLKIRREATERTFQIVVPRVTLFVNRHLVDSVGGKVARVTLEHGYHIVNLL